LKTCFKCNQQKPLKDFRRCAAAKDGRRPSFRVCLGEWHRATSKPDMCVCGPKILSCGRHRNRPDSAQRTSWPGRDGSLHNMTWSVRSRRCTRLRTPVTGNSVGLDTSTLLSGRCAAGAATGFEHPGRSWWPRGSTPSPSAGRDPAGRRGRPDKAVALGSTPRRPTRRILFGRQGGRSCLISSRKLSSILRERTTMKGDQVHIKQALPPIETGR
jgi:hypothetical protein